MLFRKSGSIGLNLTAEVRVGFRASFVRCVVDKVALGQGFLRVVPLTPLSIILSMSVTHLYIIVTSGRTNGRSLGTFQTAMLLRKYENIGYKITFTAFVLYWTIETELVNDDLVVSRNKHGECDLRCDCFQVDVTNKYLAICINSQVRPYILAADRYQLLIEL